jgi:two-component system chemotaxis response regulator CheY
VTLAEHQTEKPGRALCVLVVDDSPIMRKMVIHSLKMAKIELSCVEQAAHGEEALEVLARVTPDLVLCDVHMPSMDGLAFVRALAQSGRIAALPVVMISSERNDAAQNELESLGARAFLHKPFYPEALGQLIRSVLTQKEAS